jgi:hypothetical protein
MHIPRKCAAYTYVSIVKFSRMKWCENFTYGKYKCVMYENFFGKSEEERSLGNTSLFASTSSKRVTRKQVLGAQTGLIWLRTGFNDRVF